MFGTSLLNVTPVTSFAWGLEPRNYKFCLQKGWRLKVSHMGNMWWSLSEMSGHQGSGVLPWLALFCQYFHTWMLEQKKTCSCLYRERKTEALPLVAFQNLPYVLLPLDDFNLYAFPVIKMVLSESYEDLKQITEPEGGLGNPLNLQLVSVRAALKRCSLVNSKKISVCFLVFLQINSFWNT